MLVSAEVTNISTGEKLATENSYDGAGIRIAKTVTSKDSDDQVISSDTTHYFVSGDNLLCTYSEENGLKTLTSENVFGIDGKIIITLRGIDKYVYATDLRGSTTSILNDDGGSECVYYYEVYGEPESFKSGSLYNEIMFTGAVHDESTGLLYLSSRFYDAESGRFTSMDSYRGEINDPLSLNYYGYCEGDPITLVDTEGENPAVIIGALAGGFFSAAWEIGTQLVEQKLNNQPLSLRKVNYNKVLLSFAEGAISGALAGLTGGATLTGKGRIVQAAYEFASGAIFDVFQQKAEGAKKIDWKRSAVTGATCAVASQIGIITDKIKSYSAANEIKEANKIIDNKGYISVSKTKPKQKKISRMNYQSKQAYRNALHKQSKRRTVAPSTRNVSTKKDRAKRVISSVHLLAQNGRRGVVASKVISSLRKGAMKLIRRG